MRETFQDIEPAALAWTSEGAAKVTWSDGHESVYSPALLRKVCPCAECKGTHGGPPAAFNILSTGQVTGAVRQLIVDSVEPVGHYAFALTWGDGHREGIYSWPYLRSECPCSSCEEGRRRGRETGT